MTKYDIFISYSRKDLKQVQAFVDMLKERYEWIRIWFDITGIESGEEFEEKIVEAIDNSERVLFFMSDNALNAKWTKDEIRYALNINKKIIPILLNGCELKGWYLFRLGKIDCIDSNKSEQVQKLLRDLVGNKRNINENKAEKELIVSVSEESESSNLAEEVKQSSDKKSIEDICKENGREWVDLGLPSGLKWATCNVGATKPEEYGDYFAWGETSTKSLYVPENSTTYDKDLNWLKSNGYLDSKGNLSMEHDAARKNWGGTWRMPTKTEIEELINNSNITWSTRNGVFGCLVTSNKNGKSIFLPAAGYRQGSALLDAGEDGLCWSSTPDKSSSNYACNLNFFSGYFDWDWGDRYDGQSVRAVTE